jgi:hypothetical protein
MVYLAGGSQNNGGSLTDETILERYDLTNNTITLRADMITAKSNDHGYAVNGQFWVAGGGFNAVDTLVQIYDPATDTWSVGPYMAQPVRNYAKGWDGRQPLRVRRLRRFREHGLRLHPAAEHRRVRHADPGGQRDPDSYRDGAD